MKKNNLLNALLVILMAFSLAACGGDQSNNADNKDTNVTTRGASSAMNDAPKVDEKAPDENAPQSATKLQLARKWSNGDKYIDMKLEGQFEASLEDGVFAGNWDLDDTESTLTLSGEKAAEGKGQAVKNIFKLSKISDEALELTDEQGNTIVFAAE